MMKLLQWLLRSLCSCSPFCILWNLNWPLDPVFCDATSPASSSHFLVDLGQSGRTWCAEVHFALLRVVWSLEVAPRMPHFLSCLHRPSKNELETLELSLLLVWGFVLFLHVLMPFSSFLFTELVSFHFIRVWGNSWPKSDRCEGSPISQM